MVLGEQGLTVVAGRSHWPVAAAVPGDRLSIRPPRRQGAPAEILRVLVPAPSRLAAPCALLRRCGACCVQEMAYPAQVSAKEQALERSVAPFGLRPGDLPPMGTIDPPFGYRTRLLMPAVNLADGLRFGFYRRGTLALEPAEGCPVQHPLTLAILAMVRQTLEQFGVRATAGDGPLGWLHAVAIRLDPSSGRAQVVVATRQPRVSRLLIDALARLPAVHSVHLTVTEQRTSYPLGDRFSTIAGPRRMIFHLAGQGIPLSAGTFVQTSAAGAELLAQATLALLPRRIDCLADLYGGAGIFARLAQPRWRRALVVEESPSAIGDLRHSRIAGLTALGGRVEHQLDRLKRAGPDVVLLDPPRQGCKPAVIDAVAAIKPKAVVYLSCGFEAWLRDAGRLVERRFRLEAVRAVDMFPHTSHLELVARFVAAGGRVA